MTKAAKPPDIVQHLSTWHRRLADQNLTGAERMEKLFDIAADDAAESMDDASFQEAVGYIKRGELPPPHMERNVEILRGLQVLSTFKSAWRGDTVAAKRLLRGTAPDSVTAELTKKAVALALTESALLASHRAWEVVAYYSGPGFSIIRDEAAVRVLEKCGHSATDVGVQDEIAKRVTRHISDYRVFSGMDASPPMTEEEAIAVEKGIPRLDEKLAEYMETRFGEVGRASAADIREAGARRLAEFHGQRLIFDVDGALPGPGALLVLFVDPSSPFGARFVEVITHATWLDEVEPSLRRARRYHGSAALSRAVKSAAADAFYPGDFTISQKQGELGFNVKGANRLLAEVDPVGAYRLAKLGGCSQEQLSRIQTLPVAALDSEVLETIRRKLDEGLRVTRDVYFIRLLRHLTRVGYAIRTIEGRTDARDYVTRGRAGLAKDMGESRGKASQKYGEALEYGAVFRLPLPHMKGGTDALWAIGRDIPKNANGEAELQIILMDPILPDYVHCQEDDTNAKVRARRLIPCPEIDPPYVGPTTLYAAIERFRMDILEEFVINAEMYARQKVLHLPYKKRRAMADRVGIDRKHFDTVMEAFQSGGGRNKAAAVWEQPAKDAFKFAASYATEESFILRGFERRREKSRELKRP